MLTILHLKISKIIAIHGVSENEDGTYSLDYKADQPTPEQQNQIDALLAAWPLERQRCEIRTKRNDLLSQCDWHMLGDAPGNREAWADYRQQLRDLPQVFAGDVVNVVWPTEPT